MTVFKGYPEINFVEGQADGLHRVETNTGKVIIAGHFANPELGQRLVDCWNAVRKIFAPAAHVEATDDYTARLEKLRKEAVARIEQLEAGVAPVLAGWDHDMAAAPLGKEVSVVRQVTVDGRKVDRNVREHHVAPVWLATADGKVHRSYWIPEIKGQPGRWAGFNTGSTLPIAWQDFIVPAHPNLVSDEVAA
jgi:hypothetical protein